MSHTLCGTPSAASLKKKKTDKYTLTCNMELNFLGLKDKSDSRDTKIVPSAVRRELL